MLDLVYVLNSGRCVVLMLLVIICMCMLCCVVWISVFDIGWLVVLL